MLLKSFIMPLFTYSDLVYTTNLKAKSVRVQEVGLAAFVQFLFGDVIAYS